MKTEWEKGSRTIRFSELGSKFPADSLNVSIGYKDSSSVPNGITLDHAVIPAIAALPRLLKACGQLLEEFEKTCSTNSISMDSIDQIASTLVWIDEQV